MAPAHSFSPGSSWTLLGTATRLQATTPLNSLPGTWESREGTDLRPPLIMKCPRRCLLAIQACSETKGCAQHFPREKSDGSSNQHKPTGQLELYRVTACTEPSPSKPLLAGVHHLPLMDHKAFVRALADARQSVSQDSPMAALQASPSLDVQLPCRAQEVQLAQQ